jgi:hypothetical protein
MSSQTRIRGIHVLAAALILVLGTARHACAESKRLAQPYTYTVGDDIAFRMAGFFRVVAGLEASTLVYYDRKEHILVADVVGTSADPQGAERELESFLAAVREFVTPYAKSQHGIDLTDRDVTLVYYNDGGDDSPYEVVRREHGVYKVAASNPDQE